MKPKIYVFINQVNAIGVFPVALAEDGKCIAGHCSSNESWAKHDMGFGDSTWKHDRYKAHYPEGYELVWCDFKDIPEEVIARKKLEGEK